jgi:hypothetical protein
MTPGPQKAQNNFVFRARWMLVSVAFATFVVTEIQPVPVGAASPQ